VTWRGRGFNVIWRPLHGTSPSDDHFLELNITDESLQFELIPGPIPNRGLLQHRINMFGLWYLQQIQDAFLKDPTGKPLGLHLEPGIWANVPRTEHPQVGPTVVRMASIPHGTTLNAQGTATQTSQRPVIPDVDITPFDANNPARKIPFKNETDLMAESARRSLSDASAITQEMVNNPNSILIADLPGGIKETILLDISSSSSTPVPGGGVANIAFLQGSPDEGPNAQTTLVRAKFWIETVSRPGGGPDFHQLQYTQTVNLKFNTLVWPHVSVASLLRRAVHEVKSGDTLSSIARQFYGDDTEPFWKTIYNENRETIGPNPNAIIAGQKLNTPT
jgi:hypothetical protein